MTFKVISTAIVLAATVGSFSVFAHQSEHQGKDIMGGGADDEEDADAN
nr:hypothetical protein [uncultured Marinobacter sp.]